MSEQATSRVGISWLQLSHLRTDKQGKEQSYLLQKFCLSLCQSIFFSLANFIIPQYYCYYLKLSKDHYEAILLSLLNFMKSDPWILYLRWPPPETISVQTKPNSTRKERQQILLKILNILQYGEAWSPTTTGMAYNERKMKQSGWWFELTRESWLSML